MPITPSGFKKLRKPLTFQFAGEDVHIEYYPAAFTGDAMETWNTLAAEVNAANDEETAQRAALDFGKLICGMLATWDYCEDPETEDGPPGPPVPITPERLVEEFGKYPLFFPEFLRSIIDAIGNAVTQGKVSGTPPSENSADTSSLTEKSATNVAASLNSSASSSSPDGSQEPPASNG